MKSPIALVSNADHAEISINTSVSKQKIQGEKQKEIRAERMREEGVGCPYHVLTGAKRAQDVHTPDVQIRPVDEDTR